MGSIDEANPNIKGASVLGEVKMAVFGVDFGFGPTGINTQEGPLTLILSP